VKNYKKPLILILVAFAFAAVWYFNVAHFFSLENIKSQKGLFEAWRDRNPLVSSLIFFVIYVLTAALSLPGATVLTLLGGALFGLVWGFALVSFASTIGATIAFLVSRTLLRDWVQAKFSDRIASMNKGIEKDGPTYLLMLRLLPVFPFFIVNLAMGLTPISTRVYYFFSQLGMIPGTLIYINAGTRLAEIDSLKGLVSAPLLLSLVLLGFLPIIIRSVIEFIKNQKTYSKYKRPKKFDYNMIVIGGGSAGLVTSYIAAAVKSKVLLIEAHKMGGDCLNTGCVPSKALIKTARMVYDIKNATKYGLSTLGLGELDWSKVISRVHRVVEEIAPHDSVERYTELGVTCLSGQAKLRSPFEVEVDGKVITARNIVLATGAEPRAPKFQGLDEMTYHTSDTIWSLPKLPKKLLVVGAGAIGCELSQAFAHLGVEVTILESKSRIMQAEDLDVSDHISKRFKKDGIRIVTQAKIEKFQSESGQKSVLIYLPGQQSGSQSFETQPHEPADSAVRTAHSQIGELHKIEFDEVFFALGRQARVTGFGLRELGIQLTPQGTIEVDEYLRTTRFPNIFACGDCVGPYQFTHMAAHQAWFCAVNALFSPWKKFPVDYRTVPWATFTAPEVARVGMSEADAKNKNISYSVTHYDLSDLDRAIADSQAEGFVKVLTPPGSDKILGVTIVGARASDMLAEYVLAMKHGLGLNKILGTIHPYPTWPEGNKYAAGVWKKANAPQAALRWLNRYFDWKRN
jgi:pyruvate/2-oxoglutarate dehydrogenase complex dihydrolipoamide dehydrogenase (E3) component/uncharacterized membrane protein YdjX (TVP38/TMEM64 family)